MTESSLSPSACADRMIAEPMFAIVYRPGPAWISGKSMREQALSPHLAYMQSLFGTGALAFAGPFLDDSGGAAFVRAADEAAAVAIRDGDPAVQSGVFVGEVKPWMSVFDTSRELAAKPDQQAQAERNAKTVRDLFKAVEKREREGVLRAYDEAIAIHEAPSLPYGGSYRGFRGAFAHATDYRAAWDPVQGDAERQLGAEIVAGPDCVVVLWCQKGRNPVNAEAFEMPVASVYRMKDGRIVDSRMFHFDAAASRDFLDRATGLASA
jgi:uncharacterized protein YciI/ketosteroid isomerase-like protein